MRTTSKCFSWKSLEKWICQCEYSKKLSQNLVSPKWQCNRNFKTKQSVQSFPFVVAADRTASYSHRKFNRLYYVLFLIVAAFLSSLLNFQIFWHTDAFMHSNDDSFFLSWLNATAVSINIFLSAPAGCLIWHGICLTHLFSSRPIHILDEIYIFHTMNSRVYWQHCKSGHYFIAIRRL